MNISEIEIQNIRPCSDGHKMQANVIFHISGGIGGRFDVMHFECRCDMLVGEISDRQVSNLKNCLKTEAIRQAKRMPEFRSGDDVLVFLCPDA